ncbi:MAG: hypothetical protein HGA45_10505 [Chloroflexales bacterium]|nr:hypothetical protein [Chloroflexales bacterium]
MAHRRTTKLTSHLLVTLVLVCLLAGCTGTTPAPTPAPTPTPTPTPIGRIELQRSGGIMGLHDTLQVDLDDGNATLTRDKERIDRRLDELTLTRLRETIATADLPSLSPEYMPTSACCDFIEYRIAYNAYSIRTTDASLPDQLRPVITALEMIIAEIGRQT